MYRDYNTRRASVVTITTGSASSAGKSTKTAKLNNHVEKIRHVIRRDYGGYHCTTTAARTALGDHRSRKRCSGSTPATTAPNAH